MERPFAASRRLCSKPLLLIVLALFVYAPAAAQEPVRTFDQLNTRLKPGDTVWVTDVAGFEIKGKVRALSPGSLRLAAAGSEQELEAARVGAIKIQPHDSLSNGVLWGAGMGFALGALSCGANPECAGDEGGPGVTVGLAVMGAAAGVGIGALIDSIVKGPRLAVYRTPGAAASARLSVAPVVTPRAKGLALSVAF